MKKTRKRKGGFLLWTFVFAALLLAVDQFLLRVPLSAPGAREVQAFYRDFRQRLFALPQTAGSPAPAAPAAPPAASAAPKGPPRALPPRAEGTAANKPAAVNRYVYADEEGNLQFAESLDEVPAKLRREAKRLEH